MNTELIIPLLAAAIQSGTPILFATLGEILTEKSGVLNLGVEGIMIVGALAAPLILGSLWAFAPVAAAALPRRLDAEIRSDPLGHRTVLGRDRRSDVAGLHTTLIEAGREARFETVPLLRSRLDVADGRCVEGAVVGAGVGVLTN